MFGIVYARSWNRYPPLITFDRSCAHDCAPNLSDPLLVRGRTCGDKQTMATTKPSLQSRVQACAAFSRAWKGDVYRFASLKYASSDDLVSGKGAIKYDGRWHPKGVCRVVYGSQDVETALAESLAKQRYYAISISSAMPMVVAVVRTELQHVLDLTDPRVINVLREDTGAMCRHDWRQEVAAGGVPLSQLVGQAAFAEKWEGMMVLSNALAGAINLVVFPDNLKKNSVLRGIGTDSVGKS